MKVVEMCEQMTRSAVEGTIAETECFLAVIPGRA